MSTRTYNRVILVVNTSKILLLLYLLLFIKCNNFHMHIPSGNQLMLRRLMCLNKGLSIYSPLLKKVLIRWFVNFDLKTGQANDLSGSLHEEMCSVHYV